MKNSSIKILAITAFVLLVIPQVSLAVWWKPATWMAKDDAKIATTSSQVEVKTTVSKPVEKVVERIIEKTIQVDNPLLQKQIDLLMAKNSELQSKIDSQVQVIQQLNLCKNELSDLSARVSTVEKTPYQKQQANLKELDDTFMPILNGIVDKIDAAEVKGRFDLPNPADINKYLSLYRLADKTFNFSNFKTLEESGNIQYSEYMKYLTETYKKLKDYMVVYIKYRP